jgi:hypothetical protein
LGSDSSSEAGTSFSHISFMMPNPLSLKSYTV